MLDVTLLNAAVATLGLVGPYTWMDLLARGLLAVAFDPAGKHCATAGMNAQVTQSAVDLQQATTPLRQLYFIAQMILINPEGAEQSTAMFRKSVIMLLACFKNEEVLAELKRVDGLVTQGRAFDALKAIRALYAVEDRILNNREMTPATVEHIRKEIALW